MYFPCFRGKQFELEAVSAIPMGVFANTLPIIEPVGYSKQQQKNYLQFVSDVRPFIFIMNPEYPRSSQLSYTQTDKIVATDLATHPSLCLGYLITPQFSVADLRKFLTGNKNRDKALIFRYSPLPTDIAAIQSELAKYPVEYLIFDEKKTSTGLQGNFSAHPKKVLIADGFQRQDYNADYPALSSFDSKYASYKTSGLFGIGDYACIGDHFSEGGGQVMIVTLHLTLLSPKLGLVVHHFSSTVHSKTKGLSAPKFAQACRSLVTSPNVAGLTSSGLTLFNGWNNTQHNPHLGAAKKASSMHHMELMSSLI